MEVLPALFAPCGALDPDLTGATQLATRMVRDWGMSPRLGPVGLSNDGPNYLGLENALHRAHAEETQRVIDEEVSRLLRQAEQRATDLLCAHHHALERLIDLLEEKETVDGTEVYAIIDSDRAHAATPPTGPSDWEQTTSAKRPLPQGDRDAVPSLAAVAATNDGRR